MKMKPFLLTLLLINLFLSSCDETNVVPEQKNKSIETPSPPPKVLFYNIDTTDLVITDTSLRYGQTLGELLEEYKAETSLDNINLKYRNLFDIRRIQADKKIHILTHKKRQDSIYALVYVANNIQSINIYFGDSGKITVNNKKVDTITTVDSGIIQTSLWNTIVDANLSYELALEFADIYDWTIDFFAIQKNDKFKVYYDKYIVDSQMVGIGTIHAAVFYNNKTPFFAYLFEQDSTISYFNEKGESLKKQFLKAPLKYRRISSRFSHSRLHPILRIRRPHHGVDYSAPLGTPVRSIGSGKVIKRAYQRRGAGRYLKIKHNSVYTTVYMHLNSFAKGTTVGSVVKQGQMIGRVGSSGLSTGPHLDFRVYKNGSAIDPTKMKSPPVKPVKKELLEKFYKIRDSLQTLIKMNDE